jgi:hypothetical protein
MNALVSAFRRKIFACLSLAALTPGGPCGRARIFEAVPMMQDV